MPAFAELAFKLSWTAKGNQNDLECNKLIKQCFLLINLTFKFSPETEEEVERQLSQWKTETTSHPTEQDQVRNAFFSEITYPTVSPFDSDGSSNGMEKNQPGSRKRPFSDHHPLSHIFPGQKPELGRTTPPPTQRIVGLDSPGQLQPAERRRHEKYVPLRDLNRAKLQSSTPQSSILGRFLSRIVEHFTFSKQSSNSGPTQTDDLHRNDYYADQGNQFLTQIIRPSNTSQKAIEGQNVFPDATQKL